MIFPAAAHAGFHRRLDAGCPSPAGVFYGGNNASAVYLPIVP